MNENCFIVVRTEGKKENSFRHQNGVREGKKKKRMQFFFSPTVNYFKNKTKLSLKFYKVKERQQMSHEYG